MIPSPTAVISAKTSSTRTAGWPHDARRPSAHSDPSRASRPRTTVSAGAGWSCWSRPPPDPARRADPEHQQRRDQEGGGVEDRDRGDPAERRGDPAERAADEPGELLDLAVQRVRGDQLRLVAPAATSRGSIACSAGVKKTSTTASQREHDVHHPDPVRDVEQHQREQADGEQQVGGDHRALAVPPVHEDPGDQPDHDLGNERGEEGDRGGQRRPGDRVDRVGQTDTEQPVAGHRDQAGAEQQAQVAVPAQQLPGSAEVHRWMPWRHHNDVVLMSQRRHDPCRRIVVVDGLSEAGCSVGVVRTGVRTTPAGVTSTPTSDRGQQASVRGRAVTDQSASSEGGSDATVRRPRGRAAGTGGGCRWRRRWRDDGPGRGARAVPLAGTALEGHRGGRALGGDRCLVAVERRARRARGGRAGGRQPGAARSAPTWPPSGRCGGSRPTAGCPRSATREGRPGRGVFDLVFDWAEGSWRLTRCLD